MLKTRTRTKAKARLKTKTRTRIGTRMTFSKLRVVILLSWFRERAISGCNKNLAGPVLHGLELASIEAPGAPEVELKGSSIQGSLKGRPLQHVKILGTNHPALTNTPFTRALSLSICPLGQVSYNPGEGHGIELLDRIG